MIEFPESQNVFSKKMPDVTKLFVVLIIIPITTSLPHNATTNETKVGQNDQKKGIQIFRVDFSPVKTPFIMCVWVLIGSLAKVVFHQNAWLSSTIPESCLLILLGIPMGFIVEGINDTSGANVAELRLTSELFFFILLPPIILDAGYFMSTDIFFRNIGTILLYAIIGKTHWVFSHNLAVF